MGDPLCPTYVHHYCHEQDKLLNPPVKMSPAASNMLASQSPRLVPCLLVPCRHNPLRIFAAHEVAAMCDASMATKMTVQFNLFGGTVLKLGTDVHHGPFLRKIDTLDAVGCFGLTELGFGECIKHWSIWSMTLS